MAMSPAERRRWALAYIEAQQSVAPIEAEHPLWWAVERTQVPATLSEAEDVWAFVLEVVSLNPGEQVAAMVGAGPVEDLLDDWGTVFIDRMEHAAKADATFKKMLSHVWKSGPPEVWARVKAIQEGASE